MIKNIPFELFVIFNTGFNSFRTLSETFISAFTLFLDVSTDFSPSFSLSDASLTVAVDALKSGSSFSLLCLDGDGAVNVSCANSSICVDGLRN